MRVLGLHPESHAARARAAFALCGFNEKERQTEIAALESKDWKGKKVYKIRCHGTRGKGPHDVWYGEMMLWWLISLRDFVCPFHIGDIPGPEIKQLDLFEGKAHETHQY